MTDRISYVCEHGRLPAPCPECTTELERAIRDAAEHPPAAAQLAVMLAAASQTGDHTGLFALVRVLVSEAATLGRLEERRRCLRVLAAATAVQLDALREPVASAGPTPAALRHAADVLSGVAERVRAGTAAEDPPVHEAFARRGRML